MAIDWSRGYSCTWRLYEVSPDTWADGSLISGMISASIERSYEKDSSDSLIESGSFTILSSTRTTWKEKYLRLVMIAEQDNVRQRVAVGTLLCSSASGKVDRGIDELEITGRSVLYPASVARVKIGSFAPAGSNGVAQAAALLRETISAPVTASGSFKLSSHIVYDTGQTVLSAVWTLLNAGGFGIRITGSGTVQIAKVSDTPKLELNESNIRLLHPELSHELDWSNVPNRYIAIEGKKTATATNNKQSSPTSTVTRGYRYDIVDSSPVRLSGETLSAYAKRKLEENSIAYDARSWTREWWPDVLPGDIIRVSLYPFGIEGDYRVLRQSLTCERGITIEEEAQKEVYAWRRT